MDATGGVTYSRGFLWFLRGSTLVAQPFDANRRALQGEAVPVVEDVRTGTASQAGIFSVSEVGTVVFQGGSSLGSELVWYDRSGRPHPAGQGGQPISDILA